MTQTASKTTVYVGLEAVEGVQAATLYPIEVDVFNENDKIEEAVRAGAKGNINAEQGSEIVQHSSEPQLGGDVADQMIGLIMAGLYGEVATTVDDPEAGVNVHNFTVLNKNNHPTFSIVFGDPDIGVGEYRACLGCTVDTGEFPIDSGAFGKFDVKFMGRASVATADPAVDFAEENFFTTPNAKFLISDTLIGLDTADALCVQTGKLMITKNAKKQFCVGAGVDPKKCYNGRISAKLETTVEYEGDEYINLERDNLEKFARLQLTSGAVIGAATNPLIEFTFEKCKIRELTRDRNVEEELRQSFGIKPENMVGSTAKLINTKTAYVAD